VRQKNQSRETYTAYKNLVGKGASRILGSGRRAAGAILRNLIGRLGYQELVLETERDELTEFKFQVSENILATQLFLIAGRRNTGG
jgi:hypothetical protein